MSEIIKIEELKTVEFSIDKVCTLFFYGDRVIRGVHKEYENHVLNIFNSGMMEELVNNNLFVNTWISDLKIEGYELVIEHEVIPYWNYPYEWSFTMLKDAAMTVINCNEVANKYNYELFDVHAFNVVYKMSQPLYVDFGSFIETDVRNGKAWTGFNNFYNSFYMPLYLYSKGFSDLTNSIYLFNGLFNDKDLFLLRYKYATFLGTKVGNLLFKYHNGKRRLAAARYSRVKERYGKHPRIKWLLKFKGFFQNSYTTAKAKRLLRQVSKSKVDSYWKDYHSNKNPKTDKRFLRIIEIIQDKLSDATSLIELASNQGKFANHVLSATQIEKVIATDYDKNALDHIYKRNKGSLEVLPVVYDFVRPNNRSNTKNVVDRLSADVVMALAVTHHLILTQDVSLEHIFNVLSSLTNKYIVVEFMPLGLYSGDLNKVPEIPDFYNLDWFKSTFEDTFDLLHDEQLEVNRHVFVGQLKVNNQVE